MYARRSVVPILLFVACGLALSVCRRSEPTANPQSAKPANRELKIGYLPIAECAHLYVAISKKYFEEEKLSVKLQPMKGGATILPAVQSGDLHVGFTNVVSLVMLDSRLQADDPHYLKSACCASYERPGHLNHALLINPSSKLTPSDLSKPTTRIALNTILNIEELMLRRYLATKGATKVNFTVSQIAFPEMLTALRNNDVDVVSIVEPFIEPVVRRGDARILARQYLDVSPETLVATYSISAEWSKENPELLQNFYRAMAKADAFIRTNDAETRQIVGTFTRIRESDLALMGIPAFELNIPPQDLNATITYMKQFGFIKTAPTADSMIWRP